MTRCSRRRFVGMSVALVAGPVALRGQPPRRITIESPPLAALGEYGLGVRLGCSEAERVALLLGYEFALVHEAAARARLAPEAPESSDVPVVAMRGSSAADCVYITSTPATAAEAAAGGDAGVITDWHHAFRRYGAGELNERFEKAFSRPMTAEAWHGWIAVKAITEAAIRGTDLCAELARLRFDGHKGRALGFDATTRRLRHPRLRVRTQGEQQIVEVVP